MTSAAFNLSLLNGSNGFIIAGVAAGDRLGSHLSNAGDLNQDGSADLVIAAPRSDRLGRGYVIFSTPGDLGTSFNLSHLNGSNGFTLTALTYGPQPLLQISNAGDINNDGMTDLILGTPAVSARGGLSGQGIVVFGSASGFPSTVNPALPGNGFVFSGIGSYSETGAAISAAGDINGDGIDDFLVGVPGAVGGSAGRAYLVFGQTGLDSLNLLELDGSNGFFLNGITPNSGTGRSLSAAGDINGDGLADVIVGAPLASPNGTASGQSYVLLGSRAIPPARVNASSLNGSNGFAINGTGSYSYAGHLVSSAGDINGDGFDDLLIVAKGDPTAPDPNASRAETYLVFGQSSFAPSLNLSSLNGSNGATLFGPTEIQSARGIGDFNGDGLEDVVVTTTTAGMAGGQAHVVFGQAGPWSARLNLSSLNGSNGFAVHSATVLSASEAVDLNRDGRPDLVLGSSSASPAGSQSGQVSVLFSFADAIANLSLSPFLVDATNVTLGGITASLATGLLEVAGNSGPLRRSIFGFTHINGTGVEDAIAGNSSNNLLNGNAGSDWLRGQGGNDVLIGGTGNDTLNGGQGSDRYVFDADLELGSDLIADIAGTNTIDASTTTDQRITLDLNLVGSAQTVNPNLQLTIRDVGAIAQVVSGSQDDVLVGNSLTNLLIGNAGNDWMRGAEGADVLLGGSGNDTLLGSRGADQLTGGAGSDTLTGGDGFDRFCFDIEVAFDATIIGIDRITDFTQGRDLMVLRPATFTALSSALTFATVQTETQAQSNPALITYIQSSGAIYYNPNGAAAGFGSGGQFADVTDGLALTVSDFLVSSN